MRAVRFSLISKRFLVIGVALTCMLGSIPSKSVEAALPMVGDASLYYSNQASASSPYKFYTALPNTWSAQANMGSETNAIHFIRTVTSPVRNEKLTLLSDTNGTYKLYRWNGSSWTVDWTDSGGGGSATTYTPRYDIAYDYLGNALVVYSNNAVSTNQMAYRKFTGSTSTWGAKTNYTAAGTNAPGNTRFIRVENRPGTDEYAIVWADYQQNLSGNYFKWSNDTFAGEPSGALMDWLAILSGTGTEIQTKAFDIAFEPNSGELLVCYCSDGGTDLLCNQRTAGMGGAWQAQNVYSTAFDAEEIDLASDPNAASNQIAMYRHGATLQDGGAAIWDGGGWGYPSVFDDTMNAVGIGTTNGAVGWVRAGGASRAVITYDDVSSTGIDWVMWNGASWVVQADDKTNFLTTGSNDIWHELVQDRNNPGQIASIIVDSAADIGVKRLTFNGTTFAWTAMDNFGSSHNTNMHTTGGWSAAFAWANYTMPATLSVDIVDASGNSVASPSVNMSAVSSNSACQLTTGTLGSSSQKIRVSNGTATPGWSLSIAATGGSTARWTASADSYDYNDTTASGCGDSADADSVAGRLTLDSSVGTVTPESSCNTTGVAATSSSHFDQIGAVNSVGLLNGSSSATRGCYWDMTGISVSQQIPSYQMPGSYSLSLTMTVTAN